MNTEHNQQATIVEVPVSDIVVPDGRRPADPAKVAALARSIAANGQLQPVGLRDNHDLVFGRHRLEAHKQLGLESIAAVILHYDDMLLFELAEIDENLERVGLTKAEEDVALARRKEIYEELHPETAPGKAQAAASNQKQGKGDVGDKLAATFTEDTAETTGQSRRTIERKVRIGKNLDPKAVKALRGTKIENHQLELEALAGLPADEQRAVAARIKTGEIQSVRDTSTDSRERDSAKPALKGLDMVIAGLEELGIADAYAETLKKIKAALKGWKPTPADTAKNKPRREKHVRPHAEEEGPGKEIKKDAQPDSATQTKEQRAEVSADTHREKQWEL